MGSLKPGAFPVPMAFSDYARSEAQRNAETADRTEAYWLGQYATPVPVLDLARKLEAQVNELIGLLRGENFGKVVVKL